jgi:hypothetical protein
MPEISTMKSDECYEGKRVFWPGVRWFRGNIEPFVKEGFIVKVQGAKIKVECLNGPTLTKDRARLYSNRGAAEARMLKMLGI